MELSDMPFFFWKEKKPLNPDVNRRLFSVERHISRTGEFPSLGSPAHADLLCLKEIFSEKGRRAVSEPLYERWERIADAEKRL